MVFVLVVLTIAAFIIVELILKKRKQAARAASFEKTLLVFPTQVIERYFHPAHSWVRVDVGETVSVGVDDLFQRILGRLTLVDFPKLGTTVRQGESLATLHHGGRSLVQIAPVSGRIIKLNSSLYSRPTLINDSPYTSGWIAKIAPSDLHFELRNLLRDAVADRWHEALRRMIVGLFTPRVQPVLQDGGQIVENVGDLLDEEEWEQLVHEFFPPGLLAAHSLIVSKSVRP